MRYAVNICDLSELAPASGFNPASLLLQDFLSSAPSHVVTNKAYVDSAAVILDGPAAQVEDRVTGLVSLLQTDLCAFDIRERDRLSDDERRGDQDAVDRTVGPVPNLEVDPPVVGVGRRRAARQDGQDERGESPHDFA